MRMIFVLLLVTLTAIGIWWLRIRSTASAKGNDTTPSQSTLHLDTFVLNLAGSNERAYLRVGIDLGLDQDAKRVQGMVSTPEIRDTILGTLAEAKVDDLLTSPGKTKLKENIIHALEERVPALHVKEVYFTEFLIQR